MSFFNFLKQSGEVLSDVFEALFAPSPYEEDINYSNGKIRGKGDFSKAMLLLAAIVMRADGYRRKSELKCVKDFFIENFGVAQTQDYMKSFRRMLDAKIPIARVSRHVKENMEYSSRLHLLHFLYKIASADKRIPPIELEYLERIAILIGINQRGRTSIKAMFYKYIHEPKKETESTKEEKRDNNYKSNNTHSSYSKIFVYYQILGVDCKVTNDEIKKAYRDLAKKCHPDKVSYLGAQHQKTAKEKFQKILDAYERVKKERNI